MVFENGLRKCMEDKQIYKKDFSWTKREIICPVCSANKFKKLGIRGNREYFGADPNTEPHAFTDVVRCTVCDHIYTNPVIEGLEYLEKNHYNDPIGYQATQSSSDPSEMFRERLSFISRYKGGGHLLDIGAGKGEFLYEAGRNKWEAIGVEPSPNFCEFAREHYNSKIYEGFLSEVSAIQKSYFEVVTLNHVLEHIDHPDEILKLVSEYLVEDGLLFIEVPNADSYLLKIIDFYFKIKGLDWSARLSPLHPPYHKYGFTRKSIVYLLKRCNYKIIALKTFSGRDRGYQKKQGSKVEVFLRAVASAVVNFIGNRELLCVLAKPAK
jgi:SAM-dependent methyltransferase